MKKLITAVLMGLFVVGNLSGNNVSAAKLSQKDKALSLAKTYAKKHVHIYKNTRFEVDHVKGKTYIIHVVNYEGDHTSTVAWYDVTPSTGKVVDEFAPKAKKPVEIAIDLAYSYGKSHGLSWTNKSFYRYDHMDGKDYIIHVYEFVDDHTSTIAWYRVDVKNKKVVSLF
jgi:hypothetical protein